MQWVCLFQDDPKRQFLLGKHGKTMIHHWLLMAFGDNPKSMSRHRTLKLSTVELLNSFEAVLAAAWLPSGKRYAATAFVEATIGGVCPFLSDAFDTMKLHLFSREAVNPIFASSSWIFRNRHQTFFNSQAGSPFPETDSLTKYCLNLARVFSPIFRRQTGRNGVDGNCRASATGPRKDILFGALCFMADNPVVNALGVVTLLWLVVFLDEATDSFAEHLSSLSFARCGNFKPDHQTRPFLLFQWAFVFCRDQM